MQVIEQKLMEIMLRIQKYKLLGLQCCALCRRKLRGKGLDRRKDGPKLIVIQGGKNSDDSSQGL